MPIVEAKSERIEVRTTPSTKALLRGVRTSSYKSVAGFLHKECDRVQ